MQSRAAAVGQPPSRRRRQRPQHWPRTWPTAALAAGTLRMLTSRRPDSRLTTASRLMSRVHSNIWLAAADRMARSLGIVEASPPTCADTSCQAGTVGADGA